MNDSDGKYDATEAKPNSKDSAAALSAADITRLAEAMPPHAPGAEMSLLGAMLWDHRVIPEVLGIVSRGSDFIDPRIQFCSTRWCCSMTATVSWMANFSLSI